MTSLLSVSISHSILILSLTVKYRPQRKPCRLVSSSSPSLGRSSSPLPSPSIPQINKLTNTTLDNKLDLLSSLLPLVVQQLQLSLVDPLLRSWPDDLQLPLSPLSELPSNVDTNTRISSRNVKLLLLFLRECSVVVKRSHPLSLLLASAVPTTGIPCMRFPGRGGLGERKSRRTRRMLAGSNGETLVSLTQVYAYGGHSN